MNTDHQFREPDTGSRAEMIIPLRPLIVKPAAEIIILIKNDYNGKFPGREPCVNPCFSSDFTHSGRGKSGIICVL
jgi:hypothetical protein